MINSDNMKKIFLFALMAITSAIGYARDFTYTSEGQTVTYTVLDETAKTCVIRSFDFPSYAGVLVLPGHPMDGTTQFTLTRLNYRASAGCKELKSITIPNTVTYIGLNAFNVCTGLTSIIIPNSVTEIDDYAFHGCTGLTGTLTIPESVKSLGDYAFNDCIRITKLIIPKSLLSIRN